MTVATIDRTDERLRAFGLLPAEYAYIVARLGREPNMVELGMLGAMWSEHCGYKHSRTLLKLLPTSGPRVLQGPGENAGAVDIGDGLAVVLKMESHNHPSAVEPFQGAATGVGGILRDIFTMGARPVALLDSLRFGDPADPRTDYLVGGVIGGIGHYGNCIGVPTVGGEISFDAGYTGNPIVNAMCVGVAPVERLTRAAASGPRNPLLLVGADTGRDGLQGAAFASNEDPEASHRGVVQVGNPFLEKLLLEACLAVLETGDVLAMQDLGAAGLTSSAVEMAARGGLGVEIDVACVPRRETGLGAFEVMLSESQERMLLLVRRGSEAAVAQHFARWELQAEVVGHVTDDGRMRVRDGQELVADLPIPLLTEEVFAYDLHAEPPRTQPQLRLGCKRASLADALLKLLASPNLRSRRFAFRQYDSTVQGNTVVGPGHAAAVIRVDGTTKGLALTTDCNPRFMRADPRRGAAQAVAEAARNLACVGAEPIAVTDCLNFGNPEKPTVAWQLTEAIHGLAEACRALDVPIVSGNVSLYNETAGRAIPPTPTVGMVGLLADVTLAVPTGFAADTKIVILGTPPRTLGASEYAALGASEDAGEGEFPWFDLDAERRLGQLLRLLAARRLLRSAQDVADGGLAVAVAECALVGGVGARLDLNDVSAVALFSEDQGRAVVTCQAADVAAVQEHAAALGVPAQLAGATGGNELNIHASGGSELNVAETSASGLDVADALSVSLAALRAAWEGTP
ncbi:MAG: phosphoribosylformylglycinamidine synthase subunit PurL [Chloroflexi bacterium]|nr:phosphoribosylformylglycinamidine synthase subunit PurL [Chloroflexota bacterium]